MDPLAAQLACACVGGYAQRNYIKLADYLSTELNRPVEVVFGDNLDKVCLQLSGGIPDVIVGKESVVRWDAGQSRLKFIPLCRLTDRQGRTTQTGLFVVRTGDPAVGLPDIAGRRILFGPEDSEEKHGAAIEALGEADVALGGDLEIRGACGDGALEVADSTDPTPPVAVLSGYALPLLEGCGNIEPGALRVLAKTRPVPFITVFVNERIPEAERRSLRDALLGVSARPELLRAMESRDGFVPWISSDWTDWRGPNRDGHTDWLPDRLPPAPVVLWERSLPVPGLGGPAATRDRVILPERDPLDRSDVFRCLRARDGGTVWSLTYESPGCIDYGNSPRATPVIAGDLVYVLGAHGELHCLRFEDGSVVWKTHLVNDLGGVLPTWGYCATPLLIDDLIVVAPGGTHASLVALDGRTGAPRWRTPGAGAAYGSFIAGEFGGCRQIVGYDEATLGGWDPRSGRRLWTLSPPTSGDFNVTTPVSFEGQLLVATENNGARLYGFDSRGRIRPDPVAWNDGFVPETSSPVVVGGRVLGCVDELCSFDLKRGLQAGWRADEGPSTAHMSIVATDRRALVLTLEGELLLVDTGADTPVVLSRQQVFESGAEAYAHPAVGGRRLFLRDDTTLYCLALE